MRAADDRCRPDLIRSGRRAGVKAGLIRPALLGVTISFLSPILFAQAPDTNWSQFRGNAQLTGVTTSAPPAALTVRWTYDAGDSLDSSPAIADGSVYVGSASGDLRAIDLASGKPRWKYATGGSIGESSPAVGGGAVFFGDLTGTIHAVDVRDGSRLWTFKTNGEVKSSPTIVNDLVLIGSYDT